MIIIDNLPDNKLMSLALQGYNPFQPDMGIFCGGYQGPLYPNPTTLSYPDFNSYQYLNPTVSEYQMDNDYTGLGVGNPGIDYKNPGHILGLLDTFIRMSYGINILKEIHAGNDGAISIGPAVDILIPMMNYENGDTTLGIGDIYPSLSEIPSDWINGFTVDADGQITPDYRPFTSFVIQGVGYIPTTNPINAEQLNRLFANKTVFSYIGMPQYLRAVIEALVSTANSLGNKAEFEFELDNALVFDTYSHQPQFFDEEFEPYLLRGEMIYPERISHGKCYVQCVVQNAEAALRTLTGSTSYHDGQDGQNEYRSLTELNSVINIIPLQMVGATYWIDTDGYLHHPPFTEVETWDYTGREFRVISYMIADLVINVSNISIDPGTVTIAGEAIVHSLITDPTAYYSTRIASFSDPNEPQEFPLEYSCAQSINKTVNIEMSMTNKFTWDKTWLDADVVTDSDSYFEQTIEDVEVGGLEAYGVIPSSGFIALDQSDLVVPFSKQFTLGAGCTSIRMRVFIQNRHMVSQRSHVPGYFWWTEEYFPGTATNAQLNDPDSVPGNLSSPNMELSFTVTGDNMNPIVCNVSI